MEETKMAVKKEAVEALRAYLQYIDHLDEQQKKSLLNDFLRRHVQDVDFVPLISERALELARTKGITVEELKSIKYPFKQPGSGIPEHIRPLFTDRARGKADSKKIFHFEHNIPAAQAADMLLNSAGSSDKKIEDILALCTLCLITVEEDDMLRENGWSRKREVTAYKDLGITLKPLS
jgi:hypothetical protein